MSQLLSILVPTVGVLVGGGAIASLLKAGYVKASPNEALLISGAKKDIKIVSGKATFRIPFFEKVDRLSLELLKIDVKTKESVPTKEFINVYVDAVVTVKISNDPELMKKASQNFLNRDTQYISNMVRDVLEGNIREIVGKMELQPMINNREEFSRLVQENAVPDMNNMGLEIVSFNVQNFTDENDVIDNLGIDNTTKIQKTAQLTRIQSEKEVEIARSQANKQKNDARVQAEQEIAIKNNELELKKAELKQQQDSKRALADASYEIAEAEQNKIKQTKIVEAEIAKKQKEIELKEQEAKVQEQKLDATIRKQAEADKYAENQRADVELYQRQKEADARRYEAEQQAEAQKKIADANRYAKEQEAEGIRSVGLAEADREKEIGKAKAEAELKMAEAIEKKAEAQQKMGQASITEMYVNVLPEIARAVAEPLKNIDKITMYGEGNSTKLISDITNTMSKITEATGIDLKGVLNGFVTGKAIGSQINNSSDIPNTNKLIYTNNTEETDGEE